MEKNHLLEIKPQCMRNNAFSLRVWSYMLGQFRIKIMHQPDEYDYFGSIEQEMCTYKRETMIKVIFELATSEDPLATARAYAKPWNCESPGGRIRLDNENTQAVPRNGLQENDETRWSVLDVRQVPVEREQRASGNYGRRRTDIRPDSDRGKT